MKALTANQPQGLWYLFGVEVWERFSYYGMRALLILYLTSEYWGMSDTDAYLTYGAYVAFVYMAPVIGGYISDAYLGHTTSVKYGCVLIVIGHLLLTVEASFFVGLAFVVAGTGFFKSSMAASIGRLYDKGDKRRDAGYTLFYMAVNFGSFFAVLLVPMLAKYFGWHVGFGAAAVGMALGLGVFLLGQKKGVLPKDQFSASKLTRILAIVGALLSVIVFTYFIAHPTDTSKLLYIVAGFVGLYLLYKAIKGGKEYILAILAVVKMSFIIMIFFALFEQKATSVLLFTERLVDLNLFGFEISSASTMSLNPFFIIVLAPFFAALWSKWNPTVFAKMGSGILLTSAAMGVLTLGAYEAMQGSPISLLWIVGSYLLITMGELACSPTGLAAISKVSPVDVVAVLFGVWGIKSSFSNYFASYIATFTDVGGNGTEQAAAYFNVFYHLALVALAVGIIVLILSPLLKRIYKI
ncbi:MULTISPECIES: peptide MFS transporter [Cysteiniphilum]|uniref:MFS transporter n=1 Tax=Cysteiniphilum litorale TaxID=2056700 RepID=A0A8J2Z4S1_9GAMM|nr:MULTISPECIES: peptide MFS transporter [Cysteiniphilum]GGF98735.1 MFS transporter [Cysteiniphilum litorale]